MSKLTIEGPAKLEGEINIAGSKNHVLPMLAAMLLTTEDVLLHNIPDIADVEIMIQILELFGVKIERTRSGLVCNAVNAQPKPIPSELTDRKSTRLNSSH